LRIARFPDQDQVLDDMAERGAAVEQKYSGNMCSSLKVLPEMLRQSTPIPRDQDIPCLFDPSQKFIIRGAKCRSHTIAHSQNVHLWPPLKQLITDSVGDIFV
jgi:hypothetical protein